MFKEIMSGDFVTANKMFEDTIKSKISEAVEEEKQTIAESMGFLTEGSDYDAFVKKKMAAKGIDSLDDMDKEEKKAFFDKIDAEWNSKDEKGKDGKVEEDALEEGYDQVEKQIQNLEKRIQKMNDDNDSSGEKRKKANQQLRKLQDKIRDM